jgi:hypothetical protein
MKGKAHRLDRIVRNRKGLHCDIADGKLGPGAKEPPIPVLLEHAVAANGFGRESVAINGDREFAAQDFQATDMVAMFVRDQDAIELLRRDAALREAQDQLTRAQSAVDQNAAMVGGKERAVPGAAAAEYGQAEHVRLLTDVIRFHKWK